MGGPGVKSSPWGVPGEGQAGRQQQAVGQVKVMYDQRRGAQHGIEPGGGQRSSRRG